MLAPTDSRTRATLLQGLGWQTEAASRKEENRPNHYVMSQKGGGKSHTPADGWRFQRRSVPSQLQRLTPPSGQIAMPSWLVGAGMLQVPSVTERAPLYRQPITPLLAPNMTRAVLSRIAAVFAPAGEVDTETLVRVLAQGRPLLMLPRRAIPVLAPSLLVLVDRGPSMAPFREDVVCLAEDLVSTLGSERVEFRDVIHLDVTGRLMDLTGKVGPALPKLAGPVLALTDLGLGQPQALVRMMSKDWSRLSRRLAAAGSALTVLCPYNIWRVPPAFRQRLRLVVWDRGTGARAVKPPSLTKIP